MPPKLAKPDSTVKLDSTAKPEEKVKLEMTAKPVNTVNPIKATPSMKKASKPVKREIAENGHKGDPQAKVKKARIETAGSSAPSSSKAVPPYDEADSKDAKKEEIASDSETDKKDKASKPQKNKKSVKISDLISEVSYDEETPEEDEVERILARRLKGDIVQFRVKWKGYSLAETTWEPMENLLNAQDLVNEFEAKLKADAEKKAGKKPAKGAKNKSGTATNDQNLVMTAVNSVTPSKHAWILQYDNLMVPASQAKVMSLPAEEKATCVEFLSDYVEEQESNLEHAKAMLQQLKE